MPSATGAVGEIATPEKLVHTQAVLELVQVNRDEMDGGVTFRSRSTDSDFIEVRISYQRWTKMGRPGEIIVRIDEANGLRNATTNRAD